MSEKDPLRRFSDFLGSGKDYLKHTITEQK
jgi:hypothetical protein